MKRIIAAVAVAASASLAAAQGADAGKSDPGAAFRSLPWVTGPESGKLANQASIKLGESLGFLGEQGTSKFLELTGNPPRSGHYALVPKEGDWFAIFHFNADGYVKDNEKIDADALLKSMKEGDADGNEERKKLGMNPIYTDGWSVPPHYDTATRRLEWGVRLRDHQGRFVVNYTSRLLGREGVMTATLVSNAETLEQDRAAFAKALDGFNYDKGKSYAEFRDGDKVAAYGLGALVLGGAAAAAAKTGAGKALFKGLWIALAAGAAGIWAFVKKMMGRKT